MFKQNKKPIGIKHSNSWFTSHDTYRSHLGSMHVLDTSIFYIFRKRLCHANVTEQRHYFYWNEQIRKQLSLRSNDIYFLHCRTVHMSEKYQFSVAIFDQAQALLVGPTSQMSWSRLTGVGVEREFSLSIRRVCAEVFDLCGLWQLNPTKFCKRYNQVGMVTCS